MVVHDELPFAANVPLSVSLGMTRGKHNGNSAFGA